MVEHSRIENDHRFIDRPSIEPLHTDGFKEHGFDITWNDHSMSHTRQMFSHKAMVRIESKTSQRTNDEYNFTSIRKIVLVSKSTCSRIFESIF